MNISRGATRAFSKGGACCKCGARSSECVRPGPASPLPTRHKDCRAHFLRHSSSRIAFKAPEVDLRQPAACRKTLPTPNRIAKLLSMCELANRSGSSIFSIPRKSCQQPMPSFEMPLLQQTAVSGWVFRSPHSPLLAVRRVVGTVAGWKQK